MCPEGHPSGKEVASRHGLSNAAPRVPRLALPPGSLCWNEPESVAEAAKVNAVVDAVVIHVDLCPMST